MMIRGKEKGWGRRERGTAKFTKYTCMYMPVHTYTHTPRIPFSHDSVAPPLSRSPRFWGTSIMPSLPFSLWRFY